MGRRDRRLHGPTGPISRLLLAPDRSHHGLYAKDVERPSQIVDERRQAELGAHLIETSHQEGALIHPLLDAAEGMLDDFTPPGENVRSRLQPLRHAIERVLVFEARDKALPVSNARADRAGRRLECSLEASIRAKLTLRIRSGNGRGARHAAVDLLTWNQKIDPSYQSKDGAVVLGLVRFFVLTLPKRFT